MSKILSNTDKATKAFTAAAQATKLAIEAAQTELPVILSQIEERQSDLAALDVQVKEKTRLNKVELDIAVRENEDKVLNTLMAKRSLANITIDELAQVRRDLGTAQAENKAEVEAAVRAAVRNAEQVAATNMSVVTGQHKVDVAEKDADIRALTQEVAFQAKQIASLEATIVAEREARVSEAEARSRAAGVVVNNGK